MASEGVAAATVARRVGVAAEGTRDVASIVVGRSNTSWPSHPLGHRARWPRRGLQGEPAQHCVIGGARGGVRDDRKPLLSIGASSVIGG
jgi:hypothetical protein